MSRRRTIVFAVGLLCLGSIAKAQVTYSGTSSADAFLATGSPGNPAGADLTGLNFGGAGTLVVAPAASVKGEFQSVLKFNLANAVGLFNTNYGAGNWTITGISLELTSNYGTNGVQPNNGLFPVISGGSFVIEWLSNDDWVEGTGTPSLPTTDGVTYDSLSDLLSGAHEILCTNTYVPPGNNVPVTYVLPLNTNLVADVSGGGDVTILLYAADNQIGYLFNSYNYGRGNEPLIRVVAAPLLRILSGAFTGDGFLLIGVGTPNTDYQVQASSVLPAVQWEVLGTATADDAGTIQFNDPGAATNACRFYRLAQ